MALLLLATFGLQGQEYCRGYIQHWLRGCSIPDSSARRIFAATEKILTAGTTSERGRKRPAGEPEPDPKTAAELEASPSPTLPYPNSPPEPIHHHRLSSYRKMAPPTSLSFPTRAMLGTCTLV